MATVCSKGRGPCQEYGNMVQTVKAVLEELDYEIENDFIH